MASPVRICLVGASGRMGQEIAAAVERRQQSGEDIKVIGGIVAGDDPKLGHAVRGVEGLLSAKFENSFSESNVVVDFSSPEANALVVEIARARKVPLLVCTTGLNSDAILSLEQLSLTVPIIRASNTSVGVNVMLQLVQNAAKMLGKEFDIEIVETHHRGKKDAPSGTAVSLAQAVGEVRGLKYPNGFRLTREGECPRVEGEIGVQTLRGGDVAGEHTMYFYGNGERLEITHRATSRTIFAEGAVKAATWLVEKHKSGTTSGIFSMMDVLR